MGSATIDTTLDINDAELSLWQGQQETLRSPGYALLDGRNYRFGEAARSQARLQPQKINHRFWSQLDTEALSPAFGPSRHSADLVHSHLLDIHGQVPLANGLIIAAPGSLQHDQLALLLGIVEQCPFSVGGLVDRAVAATAASAAANYNWHVELQLRQALVTGIRYSNGLLERDRVIAIPGCGWLALQDSIARAIADAFIRQTRFDPRRQAASEQALYDLLPKLLLELGATAENNLELGGHRARIERDLLAEKCDSHYQRIKRGLEDAAGQILLAGNAALLPAITTALPGALALPKDAVHTGIERNRAAILAGEAGLHFITSLPAQAPPVAPVTPLTKTSPSSATTSATASSPAPVPQHPNRCQIQIDEDELTLQRQSGPPPQVNGEAVEGSQRLRSGDLIELGNGSQWRLLKVGEDDGTQA